MVRTIEIGRVIRAFEYQLDEDFVLSDINSDAPFVLSSMN